MDKTPVIIIPGFGQSKAALYDENGGMIKQVWPMKTDTREAAKKIAPAYLKTVLRHRDMGFSDTAYRLFAEVFEPLATLPNGEMKHNMKAITYEKPLSECEEKIRNYVCKLVPVSLLAQTIGFENMFFFAFNAFDDPFDTADRLDAFIDMVKQRTGSEKVNLLAFSMGGPIATAYFSRYGEKDEINRVFLLCCALMGSVIQADLLNRNMDKKQGYSLLGFAGTEDAVKLFKRVLSLTSWETRYRLLYRSIDCVCDQLLVNSAGMWALQLPERYQELAQRFIGDEAHRELKQKTDRFWEIQKDIPALIRKMRERGVRFFAAAGYGEHLMPLSLSQDISSDGMVPVFSSAPGTKAAPLTENGVLQKPDIENALLKDSTWYIKGLLHGKTARNEFLQRLIVKAFTQQDFTDVSGDPSLPQFSEVLGK